MIVQIRLSADTTEWCIVEVQGRSEWFAPQICAVSSLLAQSVAVRHATHRDERRV